MILPLITIALAMALVVQTHRRQLAEERCAELRQRIDEIRSDRSEYSEGTGWPFDPTPAVGADRMHRMFDN
jgi:hypothetical protein